MYFIFVFVFVADPLVIENGTFSWGGPSEDSVVLKNINVRIRPGALVAIVGPVGSGKSSLISAFLGEMEKIVGRVNTKVMLFLFYFLIEFKFRNFLRFTVITSIQSIMDQNLQFISFS